MGIINTISRLLIDPSRQVQSDSQRLRAKVLSLLSLIALIILTVMNLLLLLSPEALSSRPDLPVWWLVLLVVYLLSRTSHYELTSRAMIAASIMVLLYSAMVTEDVARVQHLARYAVIILLISSLFQPVHVTLVTAIIVLVAAKFLSVSRSLSLSDELQMLTFLGISAIFIVMVAYLRQHEHRLYSKRSADLQESEQRYRSLMEASREAIVIYDKQGSIVDANRAFELLFGYNVAEIIGKTPFDFSPEDKREDLRGWWRSNLENGLPIQTVGLHRNGSLVDVEILTQEYNYRGIQGYLSVLRDISIERKFAQEREAGELRYRALFEQTSDAVVIIGLHGIILQANQVAADLLGFDSPEELAGRNVASTISIKEQANSEDVMARLLSGEKVAPYERIMLHSDGTEIPVEISAALVYDAAGNPRHFQSMVRNLSQRKQAEAQHIQLAVERERVQVLQNFISNASHDFRTPLTNIKTNTYLIQRVMDDENRRHRLPEYFDSMNEQINRLESLLADLLTMSQLDHESYNEMEFTPINVQSMMEEIISVYQTRAESRNVAAIRYTCTDDLREIPGSKNRLTIAISNLLDNALTYTPPDGEIRVKCYLQDSNLNIDVIDTGIGIEAAILPRIFDSFYRGDAARGTAHGGTGLGLAIVKKVVEAHRGTITVESVPGEGSTFRIMLPVKIADASQP